MARYPNGVRFKHRRPKKPESDAVIFDLLRLMRGKTNAEISRKTWLSASTVGKWRTRRTRYPQHASVVAVLRALGLKYKIVAMVPADDGIGRAVIYDKVGPFVIEANDM